MTTIMIEVDADTMEAALAKSKPQPRRRRTGRNVQADRRG
jgi:hypothetical protein